MKDKTLLCCPVCGKKTRVMVTVDTVIKRLPLYCPKCKNETIVDVQSARLSCSDK